MKSLKSNLRALGVMFFIALCCWITWQIKPVQVEAVMPTRCELQEALGVKPDAKIGPKTIEAWEEYERERADYDFARMFEKMGGNNERIWE